MNTVGLVVKKDERAEAEAEKLRQWLVARGLEAPVLTPAPGEGADATAASSIDSISRRVELGVVLGGDGTLLFAARTMGRYGAPLLGVNMGGLGFLTEISLSDLYPTLEKVLAGKFEVQPRMTLEVEVRQAGLVRTSQRVLNDVVINKGAFARILDFKVKVDKLNLSSYRADGLIISTPTGSTAYNLAAGGPIVHPAHESIILTPICPFTLSNRSLILPRDVTVEIAVSREPTDVLLTSDGQVLCPLEPEDVVVVRRSERSINLVKNPYKDYFEILRTKLGWG
ncbi:MAG: NAD(+)/NADH kinase [Pseudomonadota bacterium]